MEMWKDVKNYEGLYQISTEGRLKRVTSNKIIKPIVCTNKYLEYVLWSNGKRKVFLAHRLVAIHFLNNDDNLPEVNHLDENVQNNNVSNLIWCSSIDNVNYGSRNKKVRESKRKYFKAVNQYTLDGIFIRKHESIESAARYINKKSSLISKVVNHKNGHRSAYGYLWEFVE